MTAHNMIYDFLADRFRGLGSEPIALEKLLMDAEQDGFGEVWEIDRHGMANALTARGLRLEDGTVMLPQIDGENFDPVITSYEKFAERATDVMKGQTVPLLTEELVSLTGLHRAAIPYSNMQTILAKVGIHFIPGIGYWRHPQYTLQDGSIVSKRFRSLRLQKLMNVFKRQGWPITGPDCLDMTGGFVTSRYLVRQAAEAHPKIASIGSGLYVPIDQAENSKIPMSKNVVTAVMEI
uniref:hypothetical protein n=1 Tax=uncultured Paraglaciecola sp. TaxID=1765024 RepID=UPI00262DE12B